MKPIYVIILGSILTIAGGSLGGGAKPSRSPITVHVLNTTQGKPAAGLAVVLEQASGKKWSELARGKDHVNLTFFQGKELADRNGLLEGTGKGMRHVKIHTRKDIRQVPLARLVKAAAQHDDDAQLNRSLPG